MAAKTGDESRRIFEVEMQRHDVCCRDALPHLGGDADLRSTAGPTMLFGICVYSSRNYNGAAGSVATLKWSGDAGKKSRGGFAGSAPPLSDTCGARPKIAPSHHHHNNNNNYHSSEKGSIYSVSYSLCMSREPGLSANTILLHER